MEIISFIFFVSSCHSWSQSHRCSIGRCIVLNTAVVANESNCQADDTALWSWENSRISFSLFGISNEGYVNPQVQSVVIPSWHTARRALDIRTQFLQSSYNVLRTSSAKVRSSGLNYHHCSVSGHPVFEPPVPEYMVSAMVKARCACWSDIL